MKAGITLLKTFERNIIPMKYEDMLHFLINDLVKSGFFDNKNYEQFLSVYNKIKIKNSLINNLENEIMQDNKINKDEYYKN
jgi:hypothetical protein